PLLLGLACFLLEIDEVRPLLVKRAPFYRIANGIEQRRFLDRLDHVRVAPRPLCDGPLLPARTPSGPRLECGGDCLPAPSCESWWSPGSRQRSASGYPSAPDRTSRR